MSNPTEITASPRRRIVFAVAAAIMFSLWAWSLVPPIENWGNPNEDGFSYVGVFWASIVCLPIGLFLLVGAVAGHGQSVRRARVALFVATAITILVVAFLTIQYIANNNDGRVFGVQIGLRLDRQNISVQSADFRFGSFAAFWAPRAGATRSPSGCAEKAVAAPGAV